MVLKWYACHVLRSARYCHIETERKKDGAAAALYDPMVSVKLSSSVSAVQHKDSVVRIVLASGMVEVYEGEIPAYLVMEKYPGLCLARPEVFKSPHDSLIEPKERLLPGQKFYLVPKTTVKKLRRNYPKKLQGGEEARVKEVVVSDKVEEERKSDGETVEEPVCSAKDFYVSNEKWTQCFVRRFMKGGAEQEEEEEEDRKKKPFTPPIKNAWMRQGLLGGWKPSLKSVEELSP